VTVFFVGGEPSDFTFSGTAWTITQDGTRFRTDRARCALTTTGGSGVKASFTHTALSTQWFGAYLHVVPGSSDTTWTGDLLTWTYNGTPRMILRAVTVGGVRTVRLLNVNGTAETTLATSTVAFPMGLSQLATRFVWNATGQVSIWKGETLLLNFVGNPIPAGVTSSPNGISIGSPDSAPAASMAVSEVIITNVDSRTMAVYTLQPSGNGDINQWTGGFGEVDEIIPNEADTVYANAAGKRIALTFPVPSGVTNENRIQGLKLVAHAAKGEYGPANLKIGLRQGGAMTFTDTPFALSTSFAPYSGMFATSPVSGGALLPSDLAALQFAFETAT
jgi:hypothetical protein